MIGPSLAPALAQRLDRLSRDAHAFHRFAHHPLCPAYAREVLHVGRRLRICRGCLLAALGALSGLLAGALVPPQGLAASLALLGLALVLGPLLGGPGRRVAKLNSKFLTRFLAMALVGWVSVQGVRAGGFGWLSAGLALGGLAVSIRFYRQRGPHRAPCEACPERAGLVACSGLRPILRRERAFQRLAGRWMRRG